MSRPPVQPPEGNIAFVAAATVLGIVAMAQVAAVAWFVTNYNPDTDAPKVAAEGASLLRQEGPDRQQGDQAQPQISRTHSVAKIPTIDPASITPPVAENLGSDGVEQAVAVKNKAALFYLDKGMALRNDGDMQGALAHFNSAASLEQDHPRILYEFAVTYEKMGLSNRVAEYWKTIHDMGPVRGGDYYSLADFRLKGPAPTPAQTPTPESIPLIETAANPGRKVLKVVSAIAEPDESAAEGERVVLNILIQSSPGSTVIPKYVHVRVDFYDLVNESMVDLTRAVPTDRWVTQPVDWREQAEELLEVTYFLPPQADQDILDFGQRSYHGYVIKVFYHDELQDVIVEPSTLLNDANSSHGVPAAQPPSDQSVFPH